MKVLLTGISGQDGYYLTKHLQKEGTEVYGLVMPSDLWMIPELERDMPGVQFVYGNAEDYHAMLSVMDDVRPDEVYNLAAETFVEASWRCPGTFLTVNVMSLVNVLEAIRFLKLHNCKVYQASSSEMFGSSDPPQNEDTPFRPCSPYAVSKVAAHNIAYTYRKSYGMPVFCGILFNHESPRRGKQFITRKIAIAVAEIKAGIRNEVRIGNEFAIRDWGYAGDYVKSMPLIIRAGRGDYVIATGKANTVKNLCEVAFGVVGLDWHDYVKAGDSRFMRPTDPDLIGDATKAKVELKWEPEVTFEEMIEEMVIAESRCASGEKGVHRASRA